MMTTEFMKRIDTYEDLLIARFKVHPVLVEMPELSFRDLSLVLGQKAAYSFYFPQIYQQAGVFLSDEGARGVIGAIYREEIPLRGPTHYDLLCQDLERMGMVPYTATRVTNDVIAGFHDLLTPRNHYDIHALSVLRLGCEVLAGEEYELICSTLEKGGLLTERESVFYWEHWRHDKKGSGDHTSSFDPILEMLVDTEEKLDVAMSAMDSAYTAKRQFYDQFLEMVS